MQNALFIFLKEFCCFLSQNLMYLSLGEISDFLCIPVLFCNSSQTHKKVERKKYFKSEYKSNWWLDTKQSKMDYLFIDVHLINGSSGVCVCTSFMDYYWYVFFVVVVYLIFVIFFGPLSEYALVSRPLTFLIFRKPT